MSRCDTYRIGPCVAKVMRSRCGMPTGYAALVLRAMLLVGAALIRVLPDALEPRLDDADTRALSHRLFDREQRSLVGSRPAGLDRLDQLHRRGAWVELAGGHAADERIERSAAVSGVEGGAVQRRACEGDDLTSRQLAALSGGVLGVVDVPLVVIDGVDQLVDTFAFVATA